MDLIKNLIRSFKYQSLFYDPISGVFYQETLHGAFRRLHLNDGYLYFKYNNKRIKLQGIKLAWECLHRVPVPEYHCILAKDFDKNNIKANNLLLVPSSIASRLKEAYKNLTKYLKITPHPKDVYSVVLTWRENGAIKREVYCDPDAAKLKYKKLQLRFAKLITKYHISVPPV